MNQEFQDAIQFKDFMTPVNEIHTIALVVLGRWDGEDRNTITYAIQNVVIEPQDLGLATPEYRLERLLDAKQRFIREYNARFLDGLKPFLFDGLFTEEQIKRVYS